jgi:putative membrane-bound dehydrogenase-like protein
MSRPIRSTALPTAAVGLLLSAATAVAADNIQAGLRLPAGFEAVEFADDKLAHDIFSMTVDPRGRVVVAGRGYIRILVDGDDDGKADRAVEFADAPKDGAMGLLWEGNTLWFVGDGGLRRFRDDNADDRADGPSELVRPLKTGGEHDAHDLARGPDGRLYLLCGNSVGVDRRFTRIPESILRDVVAGAVVRFSADLKSAEVVAHGFRNAYRMDFNLDGELFTYDSDNERCVGLPWYESARLYHVLPGGHHGWLSPQRAQTWRIPPYHPDAVPPVAYTGRGSPTGLRCYRHLQFPERYRGGLFLADWTFGRIYFAPLRRTAATYLTQPETFAESVGDAGFAPTDLAVDPVSGDLYVSVGGRGTRGGVYRIRATGARRTFTAAELAAVALPARSVDWSDARRAELITDALTGEPLARLHALNEIRRYVGQFDSRDIYNVVLPNRTHPDPNIRRAAVWLIRMLPGPRRDQLTAAGRTPAEHFALLAGGGRNTPVRAVPLFAQLIDAPEFQLPAVCIMQSMFGELPGGAAKGTAFEGYRPDPAVFGDLGERRRLILEPLRKMFPTGKADLDREIARTFALAEDGEPAVMAAVAGRLSEQSHPSDDVHYLLCLARLPGPRPASITAAAAAALLALDRKYVAFKVSRDTNWPLRVGELFAELVRKDPALPAALVGHADFGRADHTLYLRGEGVDRAKAAAVFAGKIERDPDFAWTPALVELIAELPEDRSLPMLRAKWDSLGLREPILRALARNPRPADRDKFLDGLLSAQLSTTALCLDALDKLPPTAEPDRLATVLRSLRRLPDGKEENRLRDRLAAYLRRATGQSIGPDRNAWTDWFSRAHPQQAARLGGADGVDVPGWKKRLAALDWSTGDATRGRPVFDKVACAGCHSGARALGPDLAGVAGRFSRDDLFTSILQPSLDVPPRYQTTQVSTHDGKVYQGLVIYEATDSLLLQTGPDAIVRVAGEQIALRRLSPVSLMPTGLLDKLSDREIADLYAYLRSLNK